MQYIHMTLTFRENMAAERLASRLKHALA